MKFLSVRRFVWHVNIRVCSFSHIELSIHELLIKRYLVWPLHSLCGVYLSALMRTLEFSKFCLNCSFNRIHSGSVIRWRILGYLLFWGFDTFEVLIVLYGWPLRQGSLQFRVLHWSFYLFCLPWGIPFIDSLCIWILFWNLLVNKVLSRLLYSQSYSVV